MKDQSRRQFIGNAVAAAGAQTLASAAKHRGTLLADLTQLASAGTVSREGVLGTWHAVDYETEEGKGVMLYAEPASQARPLTLSLGHRGWYQIRLGIYYGAGAGGLVNRMLQVKLTGDPAYTRIGQEPTSGKDGNYPEKNLLWTDIAEVFWKCADLTGQDLVIARPARGTMASLQSNLAFIRLVPMEEAQIAAWRAEQPRSDTRLLMANYDGGSNAQWGISTREDIRAEFEPLRDGDFDIALYCIASGPRTLYPSKVGALSVAKFAVPGWPQVCVKNGIDLLAESIHAAHACGVKLFPQIRVVGVSVPPRHLPAGRGRWTADHPEWFATYPDGEPIRCHSFAFPEVRDFYVRMLREWVEDYRADGIAFTFSRGGPFAYYEKPVCEVFQKQYGIDMRQLPDSDQRVQLVRASFVTGFVRQVREMLNQVGQAQGRHIPACYLVPVTAPALTPQQDALRPPEQRGTALAECLFSGLDVPTWIRDNLVDYLDVHLHVYREHDGSSMQPKIREFTDLAKGTRTKVFVDIYPRRLPPRVNRKVAMNYYAAGASGLSFWDTHNRYFRASEWSFVKRLGHREELAGWEGKGDDNYRKVPLTRLDGFLTGRKFFMPRDG